MNHRIKYILGFASLFVALVLWFYLKNPSIVINDKVEKTPTSTLTSKNHQDTHSNNEVSYLPEKFFDKPIQFPEHRIIKGDGSVAATYFKHELNSPVYRQFGFYHGDTKYEDRTKIELIINNDGSFGLFRANMDAFPTWRQGLEARRKLQAEGVREITYGNTYTTKYPEACYYYAMHECYESSQNMPIYKDKYPPKVVEVIPCTFSADQYWREDKLKGNYVSHQGFLIITCEGLDYELDNDYITKIPVLGKMRRFYQIVGLSVDENAKSEYQRFNDRTAGRAFWIWEDIKTTDK